MSGSYFHSGIGGTGKSYENLMRVLDERILCMSFENSSVNTLLEYCRKFGIKNYKCTTLHKGLGIDFNEESVRKCLNFDNYDIIFIDEIFRTDINLMAKLYFGLENYKGTINFNW